MELTRDKFFMIMTGLKSNYPNWQIKLEDRATMELWFESLKDLPYEVLNLGVMKLLADEQFYPNIAKIRKACASIVAAPCIDPTEAWGLVQKAISNYGWQRGEEALASLPPDVAEGVKRTGGWMALCMDESPEITRAHFHKAMQQIEARKSSQSVLSIGMKHAIEGYQQIAKEEEQKLLGYHYQEKEEVVQVERSQSDMESIEAIIGKIRESIPKKE